MFLSFLYKRFFYRMLRLRVSFNVISWGFGSVFITLLIISLLYSLGSVSSPFAHWQDLFFERDFLWICARSLLMALIVTLACLLVGFPMALWMSELSDKHRLFVIFLVTIPHWTGLLVKTIVILFLIDPTGPVFGWLDMSLPIARSTHMATGLALFYVYLPFMILPIYASIRHYNTGETPLHYTQPSRIFFSTTRPGLLIGSILVFIPSLGALVIPFLLGPADKPMIGVAIASYLHDSPDQGGAAVGAAATIWLVIFVLLILFSVHRQKLPKNDESKNASLEKKKIFHNHFSFFGAFGLVIIYLPLLILFFGMPSILAEGWHSLWVEQRHTLFFTAGNSLMIALVAATFACWVATLCELSSGFYHHAGHRQATSPFRWPLMLPELIIAVIVLIPFLWFGRGGGMLVLVIAHCLYCVPFAHVSIVAYSHYSPHTSRLPGIIAGFLLAFTVSLDNFTITNLIWHGEQPVTLPLLLYSEVRSGMTAQGHVLGTILLLVSLCLVTASWKIGHLGGMKKSLKTG